MEISSWLWVINIQKLTLRCFQNLHLSLTSTNICWSWSAPRAEEWGCLTGLYSGTFNPLRSGTPGDGHSVDFLWSVSSPVCTNWHDTRKPAELFFWKVSSHSHNSWWGEHGLQLPHQHGWVGGSVAAVSPLWSCARSWGASWDLGHRAAWAAPAFVALLIVHNTARESVAWKTPVHCLLPAV